MQQRVGDLFKIQPPASNRGLLMLSGKTVPTDGSDGYQTGCIFQHIDGSGGSALYVNEGSVTSCEFNALAPLGSGDAQPISFATTTSTLISNQNAHTGKVIETGTYQSTASGGVTISTTNTRPVSFLFDDAGVALTAGDDVRATLSRVLLTVDQGAVTVNALRGQLKMLDLVDMTAAGVLSAVTGYAELAGTGARTITGHFGVLRAALEEGASGTTTIAASSYMCGLECTLNSSRTYTVTGDMAAIAINISGGTSKWPVGILIDGPSVTKGIRVGKFAGSAATTSAVLFATAQDVYSDGQLSTVEVHGASNANLTSAYSAKCIRARHVVNCTTAAHETYGDMGQLVVKGTTLTHLHAGVIGTFEGHTSGVVSNGAYTYSVAAVMARVGGGGAITATKQVCGVVAFWNGAALASGSSSAFAAGDNGGAGSWTNVLAVERATNLLYLPAAGTAPCSTQTTSDYTFTKTVKLSVLIGDVQYYLIADTTV